MLLKEFDNFIERRGCKFVIMIQQSDKFSASKLKRMVRSRAYAFVALSKRQLDPRFFPRQLLQIGPHMRKSAGIVMNTQFPVGITLLPHRCDSLSQQIQRRVVHRHDYADQRRISELLSVDTSLPRTRAFV